MIYKGHQVPINIYLRCCKSAEKVFRYLVNSNKFQNKSFFKMNKILSIVFVATFALVVMTAVDANQQQAKLFRFPWIPLNIPIPRPPVPATGTGATGTGAAGTGTGGTGAGTGTGGTGTGAGTGTGGTGTGTGAGTGTGTGTGR